MIANKNELFLKKLILRAQVHGFILGDPKFCAKYKIQKYAGLCSKFFRRVKYWQLVSCYTFSSESKFAPLLSKNPGWASVITNAKKISALINYLFFQLLYLESSFFYLQLTLRQIIWHDFESRFIVRFQLSPSIQSGFSPCARLQVVTQSTYLTKNCYPQLVLYPHRSEIETPKQLDYRYMPLHLVNDWEKNMAYIGKNPSKTRLWLTSVIRVICIFFMNWEKL